MSLCNPVTVLAGPTNMYSQFHQALLESANSLLPIGIPQLRQLVEGPPRPGRPGADSSFHQQGGVISPSILLDEAIRCALFDHLEHRTTIISAWHGSPASGR